MEEGKFSGLYNIIPVVLKRYNSYEISPFFANRLLMGNMKLKKLSELTLLPISRSTGLSNKNNHRVIALSSRIANLINE